MAGVQRGGRGERGGSAKRDRIQFPPSLPFVRRPGRLAKYMYDTRDASDWISHGLFVYFQHQSTCKAKYEHSLSDSLNSFSSQTSLVSKIITETKNSSVTETKINIATQPKPVRGLNGIFAKPQKGMWAICQIKLSIAFVTKLKSVLIKLLFFLRQHLQFLCILPTDYPCFAFC